MRGLVVLCLTMAPTCSAPRPPAPLTWCRCVSESASTGSPSARTSSASTSGLSTTAWRRPRWGWQGLWGVLPLLGPPPPWGCGPQCWLGMLCAILLWPLCPAGPGVCQHASILPLPHHHGLPRLPAGEGRWWWPPACDGDVTLVGTSEKGDTWGLVLTWGRTWHWSGCCGCNQGMLCQVDGLPTSGVHVQAWVWRDGGRDWAPPASLNPWGHMLLVTL